MQLKYNTPCSVSSSLDFLLLFGWYRNPLTNHWQNLMSTHSICNRSSISRDARWSLNNVHDDHTGNACGARPVCADEQVWLSGVPWSWISHRLLSVLTSRGVVWYLVWCNPGFSALPKANTLHCLSLWTHPPLDECVDWWCDCLPYISCVCTYTWLTICYFLWVKINRQIQFD
mgnify:CR=1 FL=1